MLLISSQSLNGHNSASRRAREVPKKGNSSEFNPQNYEQVKSSPSLKVLSHESVKDTVKFDKWVNLSGAKKYQIFFSKAWVRCVWRPEDPMDQDQLKN